MDGLLNRKKYYFFFFSFWRIWLFKLLHNVDKMNCTWRTNLRKSDWFKGVNVEVDWHTSIATAPPHKVWLYIILCPVQEYPTHRDVIIVGEGPLRGAYSFRTRSYPYLAALARILDPCLCDLMWRTAPQRYSAFQMLKKG